MNLLGIAAVLGLLVGAWAQIHVERPLCDSLEAEEAALVAQDYLNAQHKHGYKYALNRIDDIKILKKPNEDDTYVLEIDLLETDCHALDPTPVVNCTVRPKVLTAVEGDCDVVLKRVNGALTVTAFKCKTEESTEDLCVGCPTLLPLNHTGALDFVTASLVNFNNQTENVTYALQEIGRMSTQIVSGGPIYLAEYVVVEANCTEDPCVPLADAMATRGFCTAKGSNNDHTVDCKMFTTLMPIVDANATAHVENGNLPVVHVHKSLSGGLKHHKLTTLHDPHLTGLLSAESAESAEVVPVADAAVLTVDPVLIVDPVVAVDPAAVADPTAVDPTVAAAVDPAAVADAGSDSDASDASSSKELPHNFLVKRAVAAEPAASLVDGPAAQTDPVVLVPVCPGKIRFF